MICLICNMDKPIESMVRRNDRLNCYRKLCKSCKQANNHKPAVVEQNANHYQKNKATIREMRKVRRNNNINERLANSLRSRLRLAIKNNSKTGSAVRDLGCSVSEFKQHLESRFQEGMSWDNYGIKGWHIDHIEPISKFNLTDIEQVKIACHYTNLQPLWAKDNLSKGIK